MGEIIKRLLDPLGLSSLFPTACGWGADGPASKSPGAAPTVDNYTQIWTKAYSKTTYSNWLKVLTATQQFAGAADMLTSGLNQADKGNGMSPGALTTDFQAATTDHFLIPSMTPTVATYAVHLDGMKYRP